MEAPPVVNADMDLEQAELLRGMVYLAADRRLGMPLVTETYVALLDGVVAVLQAMLDGTTIEPPVLSFTSDFFSAIASECLAGTGSPGCGSAAPLRDYTDRVGRHAEAAREEAARVLRASLSSRQANVEDLRAAIRNLGPACPASLAEQVLAHPAADPVLVAELALATRTARYRLPAEMISYAPELRPVADVLAAGGRAAALIAELAAGWESDATALAVAATGVLD